MASFTTNEKKDTWEVRLTIGSVDRIKDLTKVDILDEEDTARVFQDARLAIAVLVAVIKPQLDAKGITPEAFLDFLDGDACAAGADALFEAIVNFSRPEQRATRGKIVKKIKEANQLQADREESRLLSLDEALAMELDADDKKFAERLAKRRAEVYGEQPADSASTPAS